MSALRCELKAWWIYKVAVRSFPHFPHSYKSLALSKYTLPNDFTMTIHPHPLYVGMNLTIFLNSSARREQQRLWKCYKTERRAWLGIILIPKVCSNFRTCGFSWMINDWSMSDTDHILHQFPSARAINQAALKELLHFSGLLLSTNGVSWDSYFIDTLQMEKKCISTCMNHNNN